MHRSNRIIISLAALGIIIALGMYLNRRHLPPTPAPDLPSVTAQTTNRAPVHVQRPSATAEPAQEAKNGGPPQPPREKVDEYLRRHERNAASLLTAFHALQDTNYLREAATNFPNDPRVQWTILARDAFPEDRRKWLDAFKSSSSSNSLANYLSAQDYFKNNQPDAAIKELSIASNKSQFQDYLMETILDGEDLGRFSGSSPVDTHTMAEGGMASDMMPELADFKSVALGIKEVQLQYLNSGDTVSAQNLAQLGFAMANRLTDGEGGKFAISHLVGTAAEAIVLQAFDQNTSYDVLGGQTPAQRLADLRQQRRSITELTQYEQSTLSTMSEDQMINYWERAKVMGELEAMRWLQQQNVTPNTGN